MTDKHWYVCETTPNQEYFVAYTIACLGHEFFLPLELVERRLSTHSKRKCLITHPTLHSHVFFQCAPQALPDIATIQSVKRIVTDAANAYCAIPKAQMDRFIGVHKAAIELAREAHARGKSVSSGIPRPKFKRMTKEALQEYMQTYFPDVAAAA